MTKYKCNKCGLIAENKRQIPLEHGKMGITVYPQKNTSQKCMGNFKEDVIHLECSNCDSSWDSCQYHLSEIGKSCCKECWHELHNPLAVNKKEDGLPPTDKSVGIRPTIL